MVKTLNKNNNKGCLSGILGTLAVIVGVVIFALFSSLINNLFLSARFGDRAECALLPLSIIIIVIAFVLFEAIFIVRQIWLGRKGTDSEPKLKKTFFIISVVCLLLTLLLPIVSACTYTKLSEDTISKVCFVEYKSYDLDTDMSRCVLACDSSGKLTFTITMVDGEKIELLGTVNSCGTGFVKKYENLYGYAEYLSGKLYEQGYPLRVIGEENMKLYKETHPEIWKYLEKIIELTK